MSKLLSKQVTDPAARDNFLDIEKELNSLPIRKGDWTHLEIVVNSAVANFKFPHSLGFLPKDVIQTAVTNGVNVTWHYSNFTRTHLDITTDGACTVRAFVGTYIKR